MNVRSSVLDYISIKLYIVTGLQLDDKIW